jgi:hypothetical protein
VLSAAMTAAAPSGKQFLSIPTPLFWLNCALLRFEPHRRAKPA